MKFPPKKPVSHESFSEAMRISYKESNENQAQASWDETKKSWVVDGQQKYCTKGYTLETEHVETKYGRLEDDSPFQLGEF